MSKAREILELQERKITVQIAIGEHLQNELLRASSAMKRRIAIIADTAVLSHAEKLKDALQAELFPFSGGEKKKTRETKQVF